ncbi:MAG: T9SS type A sorting domain-containing protein, partial [Bacteroidota bacterium]
TGNVTQTECIDIATTPFAYQIFFNSPFDPNHNSDFAQGITSLGGNFGQLPITLEDLYNYYQNSTQRYAITGIGATVNGIPIPSQGNPIDIIYQYPLTFGDYMSHDSQQVIEIPTLGYRKTEQTRINEVDGWGTINVFGTPYESIRVKTTIYASDSIYVETFGFGFQFDRPVAVEYKWLVHEWRVPVVQVNYTGGNQTGVLLATTPNSVMELSSVDFEVYPNPTTDRVKVNLTGSESQPYQVWSCSGQLLQTGLIANQGELNFDHYESGIYMVQIAGEEKFVIKN